MYVDYILYLLAMTSRTNKGVRRATNCKMTVTDIAIIYKRLAANE